MTKSIEERHQIYGELPPNHWTVARKKKRTDDNSLEFDEREIEDSIIHRWRRVVSKFPNHIALSSKNSQIEMSYRELDKLSDKIAFAICKKKNERKIVALLFNHGYEAIVAILGVLKAGCAYVPLDLGLPVNNLKYQLEDSTATLIVALDSHELIAKNISADSSEIILYESALSYQVTEELAPAKLSGHSLLHIIYTSGTTGNPKGITWDHSFNLYNAHTKSKQFYLSADDRTSFVFNWSYAYASNILFTSLLNAGTLVIDDPKFIKSLTEWVLSNRVNLLVLPGSLFRTMFTDTIRRSKLNISLGELVDCISLGGQILLWEDVHAYVRQHGADNTIFRFGLGSSEGGALTDYIFHYPFPHHSGRIPIGFPTAKKEITLVDESNNEVAQGEVGEIVLRSQYMSNGYWNNSNLNADTFIHQKNEKTRLLHTGDQAYSDDQGVFHFVGRKDEMVKIRGHRVELPSIEVALKSLTYINEVAVLAPESVKGERQVIAFVKTSATGISDQKVRKDLGVTLASYAIPSRIIFIKDFPYHQNGKIDYAALSITKITYPANVRNTAPLGKKDRIVDIIRNVLKVDILNYNDNLFELGADSLVVLFILSEVESEFAKEIDASDLYANPTVNGIAELLNKETDKATASIKKIVKENQNKRSFRKIVFDNFLRLSYHIHPSIMLWGIQKLTNLPIVYSKFRYFKYHKPVISQFLQTVDSSIEEYAGINRSFHSSLTNAYLRYRSNYLNKKKIKSALPFNKPKYLGEEYLHVAKKNKKGIILVVYRSTSEFWNNYQSSIADYGLYINQGHNIEYFKADVSSEKIAESNLEYAAKLNKARRLLDLGKVVRISPDGSAGRSKAIVYSFFGRKRPFYIGFAELALLTNSVVIPLTRKMETRDQVIFTYHRPFDLGPSNRDRQERIKFIVDQYVKFISQNWKDEPWSVPLYTMKEHLAFENL